MTRVDIILIQQIMDEETNQGDTTAIAAVITAVVSYNNPEDLLLPEDFATKVSEIIQNGMKSTDFTSHSCQHPSCCCTNVTTCSECMILSALSAIESVFEFLEERIMNTTNSSDNDNQSEDNVDATLADNLVLKQCQPKTAMEKWYLDAARLLSSRTSTDLLVKCLISSSKFKSFLARKILLYGMNTNLIEIIQVLTMLKQECRAVQFCAPLLEILRDMMSGKKCTNKQINSTAFLFFKEMEFHGLIGARCSENKKSFVDTSGFLEYMSLLCKVIKYVICSFERIDIEDIEFTVAVVDKICLTFGDYFFIIPRADKGHLICLQYMKAINLILDIRFLENKSTFQEKLFQISKYLRTRTCRYFEMAEKCGLLCNINFIGAKLNLQTKDSMNCTSSLKRQIIILVFKSSAFSLKGECDCYINIERDLESFWCEISSSVSKYKNDNINDWLPVVFADQDDQWITALICLLIIHKELKKWHSKQQGLRQMSVKTIDNQETSPTLLQTICPHRLFLQLVKFIDYDHLVLTDFLTSPETPFLFYLTQYMHVIIEDWQGFLSVFVSGVQEESVKGSIVHEWENHISDMCTEMDITSYDTTKHNVFFPELSTSKDLQFGDLSQNSDRMLQVLPERNKLLLCQQSVEVITASNNPSQSLNSVPDNPLNSPEPQSNPLLSSLAPDNYNSQMPAKTTAHNCEVASCVLFTYSTSGSVLHLLTPTSAPSNSSTVHNDAIKENSVNQYFSKQVSPVSQKPKDDANLGMCDRTNSRSFTSLVAYSDSDSETSINSETSMTEIGINSTVGEVNLEEHSCNIGSSDELGSRMEANRSCMSELDSECENGPLSEHGSATDCMGDQYVKCTGELDAVMGMIIRLRLHVERLDYNKLFPYNAKSLLRLLESCEELYEMPNGS